ncbi:hypothetical protein FQR65_LT15778 [Abscondita terminalis]|nr:hypothetical protein FQR65_LT15778 [Abscondita terminalis]
MTFLRNLRVYRKPYRYANCCIFVRALYVGAPFWASSQISDKHQQFQQQMGGGSLSPQMKNYAVQQVWNQFVTKEIKKQEVKKSACGVDKAKAKADSIKNLIAKGEAFGPLAIQFSQDEGSKATGGDLGPFGRGRMVPEFDKAVFEGKTGDVLIVNSQFGVHIVKIEKQIGNSKVVKAAIVDKTISISILLSSPAWQIFSLRYSSWEAIKADIEDSGGGEADPFIAKAKEGLDPSTQYHTLLRKFETKPDDVQIARKLALAAENAYDEENKESYRATDYQLFPEQELFQNENLIKNNYRKDRFNIRKSQCEQKLCQRYDEGELVYHFVKKDKIISLDEDSNNCKSHPEGLAAFKDAAKCDINTFKVAPNQLNSFAWTVFENCEDKACIESALVWSKKSLEKEDKNAAYLDTYANLLYKNGNKDEAITIQEKAVATADEDSKEELQAALDKMRNGQPTW